MMDPRGHGDRGRVTESHVAGLAITWDGRFVRQRCAWCGAVLVDHDLGYVMVETPSDGSTPEPPPTWPVDALVRIDGHMRYTVNTEEQLGEGQGEVVPDDCCMRLDPEVTA